MTLRTREHWIIEEDCNQQPLHPNTFYFSTLFENITIHKPFAKPHMHIPYKVTIHMKQRFCVKQHVFIHIQGVEETISKERERAGGKIKEVLGR